MNLIFCKLTSLRGAHGVGRGDGAPLGLTFLEMSITASWGEGAMWGIVVAVGIDFNLHDEKRNFSIYFLFLIFFHFAFGLLTLF